MQLAYTEGDLMAEITLDPETLGLDQFEDDDDDEDEQEVRNATAAGVHRSANRLCCNGDRISSTGQLYNGLECCPGFQATSDCYYGVRITH